MRGKTEKYRHNRKNQLTRQDTEEGVRDYTFDPQGNLARETDPVRAVSV